MLGIKDQGRCRGTAFGLVPSPGLLLTVTTAKLGKTEAEASPFTGTSLSKHTAASPYAGTSLHPATSPPAGISQPATQLDSTSTEDTSFVPSSSSKSR